MRVIEGMHRKSKSEQVTVFMMPRDSSINLACYYADHRFGRHYPCITSDRYRNHRILFPLTAVVTTQQQTKDVNPKLRLPCSITHGLHRLDASPRGTFPSRQDVMVLH